MENNFILLGCDADYNLMTRDDISDSSTWTPTGIQASSISVLPDGRILGIDPEDHSLNIRKTLDDSESWKTVLNSELKGGRLLLSVSCLSDRNIYGIDKNRILWVKRSLEEPWELVGLNDGVNNDGVYNIAQSPDGTLIGGGFDGTLENPTGHGLWETDSIGDPWQLFRDNPTDNERILICVAVQPDGVILAFDRKTNELLWRNPLNENGTFQPVPNGGNIPSISVMNLQDTIVYVTVNKGGEITFSDNRGDIEGKGPSAAADYVSIIDKGRKITWESEQSGVCITNVTAKPNAIPLMTDGKPVGCNFEGTISNDYPSGTTESYSVTVSINGVAQTPVDPKIRIH